VTPSEEILYKYWGFKSFRPLQSEIIDSVLEGRDTLALLPTGGGKSICFQVPALMFPGLCLVVSPLIALMKDQVINLRKKGIKAEALISGMPRREMNVILDNAAFGKLKFLYVSPERLKDDYFQAKFAEMKLGMIAVDEAHCISQWGYDFRPHYLEIADVRTIHPKVPVLALTATARKKVIGDIQERLKFKKKNLFQKSFYRSNLSYMVFEEQDKYGRLLNILNKKQGSAIVYMRSRKGCMKLASFLKERKISAEAYHAGLDSKVRNERQAKWIDDKIRVMVATNAFGMGIDKPDVRVVVHLELPDSLESYFQEAGRAGRDEEEAFAVMLFEQHDIKLLKERLESRYPTPDMIRRVYEALGNYFQLPEGGGEGAEFEFDIQTFCKRFDLKVNAVYPSLKELEREAYIDLLDDPKLSSRVQVLASKRDIYNHQEKRAQDGEVLQVVLRNHTSVFNHPVKIREEKLASKIGMKQAEFERRLLQMHKLGLVDYTAQSRFPRILYPNSRIKINNLQIDAKGIRSRKKEDQKRCVEIINYVESDYCRSALLLKYFGERIGKKCGTCDHCIREKSKSRKSKLLMRDQIEEELREPSVLKELVRKLDFDEDALYAEVRSMVDEGLILYDELQDRISKK
jgi:ATP-dependent DNA helicase RecQ